MAEKFDLSVILRFIDKTGGNLANVRKNLDAVSAKMKMVGQSMSVAVTAPLIGFGVNAIRMGADFQNIMNTVGAVTGATGDEFEKLKRLARDLGATTQFSATQAGEAMRFMGMAGFDTNKIMAATPKVLELAAAAQLDMGSAADITTNIMSGFGFQAKEMARVNDVLVNTFTSANVSLPQMGEAMKKVGPIASKMKFRFTEIAAAFGIMGNNGIQGSEAGVALRRALINLQNPTKQQQEAMRYMELQFKNTDGTMKDLTGIIGEYENAVSKGADETDVMTSMMQIFGPRAVAPMLALLEAGSKGLQEMEEKTKKEGTATEIAQRKMKGLPGALKLIQSAWESLNIALTEGKFGEWVDQIARGFAGLLQDLSKFVDAHPELVQWGVKVAAVFAASGPVLLAVAGMAKAISFLLSPVGAIGLLIASAALIILNWEPIKQFFLDTWKAIADDSTVKFNKVSEESNKSLQTIKDSPLMDAIKADFNSLAEVIGIKFGEMLNDVDVKVSELSEKSSPYIEILKQKFNELGVILEPFKEGFRRMGSDIVSSFLADMELLKEKMQPIVDEIKSMWQPIKDFFGSILDAFIFDLNYINNLILKVTDPINKFFGSSKTGQLLGEQSVASKEAIQKTKDVYKQRQPMGFQGLPTGTVGRTFGPPPEESRLKVDIELTSAPGTSAVIKKVENSGPVKTQVQNTANIGPTLAGVF